MAGYRWRFPLVFVELGLGAGVYRERLPRSPLGPAGGQGGTPSYGPIPDGVLGFGFDF